MHKVKQNSSDDDDMSISVKTQVYGIEHIKSLNSIDNKANFINLAIKNLDKKLIDSVQQINVNISENFKFFDNIINENTKIKEELKILEIDKIKLINDNNLETENLKLNISYKDKELKDLKNINDKYLEQIKDLNNKINDVHSFNTEIIKLKSDLCSKDTELKHTLKNLNLLNEEILKLKNTKEINQLNDTQINLSLFNEEISKLKTDLFSKDKQLNDTNKNFEYQNYLNQNNLKKLQEEMKNLKINIEIKDSELNNREKIIQDTNNLIISQKLEFENKIATLENLNYDYKNKNIKLDKECDKIYHHYKQMKEENERLLGKLQILEEKNKKILHPKKEETSSFQATPQIRNKPYLK
jgi:chromosome segregation ATPase